jgi:hypothetical protein
MVEEVLIAGGWVKIGVKVRKGQMTRRTLIRRELTT